MGSEFLVIGSGGGATIAKELAENGKKVTIIEKGGFHKLGTPWRALKFYSGGILRPGELSEEKPSY